MKKFVLRLLALVLVLCMVVPCTPVLAYAEMTRPEGMTDEEWERLRQQQLAELAAATPEPEPDPAPAPVPDTLSKSEEGNLVVTDDADATPVATAPEVAKDQNVSVELPAPVNKDHILVDTDNDHENDTYEYDTTIKVGDTTEKISVEESYDLDAKITEVETEGTGDKNVTDITYNISLNGVVSAEDAKGEEVIESTVVENVDIADNEAVEEANKDPKTDIPQPQYKVDMSVNGMNADEITRVEHTYQNTDGKDEVEYYYNAKNGTEDTSKKYFSVVEKVKDSAANVKEKVVSLWTGFLGIFHITTDAFEGTADENGKKDTYSNLDEAAKDNDGETVEMLRNYETNTGAVIENDVTVDLNGHSYTDKSGDAAIAVVGKTVTIRNGDVISAGYGLWMNQGNLTVEDTIVDAKNFGVHAVNADKLTLKNSVILGATGVMLRNTNATIQSSYVAGKVGPAVRADLNTGKNIEIKSGWFESGKSAANIESDLTGKAITITGGRFTKSTDLYKYAASGYAVISHNDGSYFLYEVADTDYKPTRDGYYFKGYRDAMGNTISLKEASKKGIIAYARWEAIPETTDEQVPLITVKTNEKGCTTKVIYKGDTAFVTVKDAKGEFAPISEVVITSIKRLQNRKIDTVEIQVDEDVTLVLDIEKAKLNGFTDVVEVMLQKDMLLITSGQDTCIELDIGELKEADKPVTIQLVEGELTIMLGKNSSMTVDLTKALKTKERIVVKLENGVLKLYDKYHKPIKD